MSALPQRLYLLPQLLLLYVSYPPAMLSRPAVTWLLPTPISSGCTWATSTHLRRCGGTARCRAWQTTQSSAHCCEHRDVLCGGECCAARSALHPCPFSASSPFTTFTVCQPQSALSHVFTMHLIQNVSPSSSPFPVSSAQPRYLMSWRLVWLSVEPSGWWDQHCSWTTFWTQCCEGGSPHTHAHETISWLSVGLGRLGSSRYSVSHTYALYICLHVKTRR